MRKGSLCAPMITLCLLLTACGSGGTGGSKAEELALSIRTEYLAMSSCTANLAVTADYGERTYEYGLNLGWQKESGFSLVVTAPEDVAGVTVTVAEGQTALEYDGARIETGAITPDGSSPIDALPAFFDYARQGFMASCVMEGEEGAEALRVDYREPDGTPGQGTEATLWFDTTSHALVRAELLVDGAAVIRCAFTGFQMA